MAIDFLLGIVGVVFGLGLMVLIHEWGHFLVARAFGVRVDVFSVGFGPRLFGIKRGNTDYRLSALPLGGYVRMAGDNTFEERAGAPDEMLSKPRWQRILIGLAGPTMNILLALVIVAGLALRGTEQPLYENKPVDVAGVLANSPAQQSGIQAGDRVVEFDGVKNPTWDRLTTRLMFSIPGSSIAAEVERNGNVLPVTVQAVPDEVAAVGYPIEQTMVDSVTPNSQATLAGLKPGDQILSLNGQPLPSPQQQLGHLLQQTGAAPVQLGVLRGGQTVTLTARPTWLDPGDGGGARWQLGFEMRPATIERKYSPFQAVAYSVEFNGMLCRQLLNVVVGLFRGKVSVKELEGPLGIARDSGRAAQGGIGDLLRLMVMISVNLGVLNLLPMGPLDGGMILMLLIEGAMRHDLSLRAKERFVTVSVVFLLCVFAIVMYNDVLRLLPHH
ncbi:MAG: RIP metalloprotease RseP [Candidatus Acidiferrales bacterium]